MLPSAFFLLLKLHNGKAREIENSNKNLEFLLDKSWLEKEKKKATFDIKIAPFKETHWIPTGKYMITSKGKSALYKSIGTIIAAIVTIVSLIMNFFS